MKKIIHIAAMVFSVVLSSDVLGQVSFTTIGIPVTENFDGLGTVSYNLTDNTPLPGGPPGVYAFRNAGNAVPNIFVADTGSSGTGQHKNYGTAAAADRTLGALSSGTPGTLFYGVRYLNNTGVTISTLTVTYTGEQWRKGGELVPHILAFSYQQAATVTSLTAGTFIPVTALDFSTPTFTATSGALDGNNAANRATITAIFRVIIPAGEEVMLRWTDINDAGTDHGMGIDDLSVTPSATLTASAVSVGGRVATFEGNAISRARVSMVDSGGAVRSAMTNQFGYYRFEGVASGSSYVLSVRSKLYEFAQPTRVISASEDVLDVNFTALPSVFDFAPASRLFSKLW